MSLFLVRDIGTLHFYDLLNKILDFGMSYIYIYINYIIL
jgi:hypothetical protein